MADTGRVIETVLNGLTGPLEVNGQRYNGTMPSMGHLMDEDIADVLTYIRSAWGNTGVPVTTADVAAVRAKTSH